MSEEALAFQLFSTPYILLKKHNGIQQAETTMCLEARKHVCGGNNRYSFALGVHGDKKEGWDQGVTGQVFYLKEHMGRILKSTEH